MDFINDPMFSGVLGRSDFIGGIDNEALDFDQLDAFIHGSTGTNAQNNVSIVNTQSHLPESPPDSGSEPPYSPSDLHGTTLSANNGNVSLHHPPPPSSAAAAASSSNNGQPSQTYDADVLRNSINNHLSSLNSQSLHVSDLTLSPHLLSDTTASIYLNSTGPGSDTNPSQSHLVVDPEVTLKHEGDLVISNEPSPDQTQFMLHQQGSVTLIELGQRGFKNDILELNEEREITAQNGDELVQLIPAVYNGSPNGLHHARQNNGAILTGSTRKRKSSQANIGQPPTTVIKAEPDLNPSVTRLIGLKNVSSSDLDAVNNASLDSNNSNAGDTSDTCSMQSIRFAPFQQHQWHVLCNQNLQELPVPHYRVDADKGFNFSNSDDAFVCQKKNHFQITVHAQLHGSAVFVRTNTGLEKIRSFHLHFYGVKLEAPNQTIRIEQSQSDRSKKPFHPVPVDLHDGQVSKITVGRLHFSETTNNNMRKKGRPNPEQRYFQLVVGLHAHTHSGNFPIVSQGSERIIVRASNPGQFENDVELCWQRGITLDSIYHSGRVGINTDRPDESLVVHGNIKISGHIVQPSDSRAKQEISELDTSRQLENVQKIRVVKYRYEPEFAIHSGLVKPNESVVDIIDTGVIAQEVQKVLPDAVQPAGSIILPSGQVIDNFLLVNKDRIFMENIGAVKELCKVTGSLETRIEQLERINARLMRIQKHKRSKSCPEDSDCNHQPESECDTEICSNKTIQFIIIILIIIMTVCLTAISTLYFVERQRPNYQTYGLHPSYVDSNYEKKSDDKFYGLVYPSVSKPLHTTFAVTRMKPTQKSIVKDGGGGGGAGGLSDEYTKPTRNWSGPIAPNEADDAEISSNAIEGTQYEAKKNESTKAFQDTIITKTQEAKGKNSLFNFKGPGPETPQESDENAAFEDSYPNVNNNHETHHENRIVIQMIGQPHFCDTKGGPICQSMCCDETRTSHNLEKRSCIDEPEMSSDLKYNVTHNQQEDVPIDIKELPHIITNDDTLEHLNTSMHSVEIETPIHPKENDDLGQPEIGCYTVTLVLRTNSFNKTLSVREICNVQETLEKQLLIIPISRYMRDTQIELLFINPKLKEWSLCEHKNKANEFQSSINLDASGNQIFTSFSPKELTKPSFNVQIPQFGGFERELEFRTLLKSTTKSVCQLAQESTGLFLQYNIKFYRECN